MSEVGKGMQKVSQQKKSVLRSTSLKDLKAFKWAKLLKEWKAVAPTLYKFLRSASNSVNSRQSSKLKQIIATAGAILLKGRNQRMSAVQHLVGLCLFLGRTRKKVHFFYFFIICFNLF